MARTTYWWVPSSSGTSGYPVVRYSYLQSECCCPARTTGEGAYPCWHSLLVMAVDNPTNVKFAPVGRRRKAVTGDVFEQLGLLMARAAWLLAQGQLDAARMAFSTATKYSEALLAQEKHGQVPAIGAHRIAAAAYTELKEIRKL